MTSPESRTTDWKPTSGRAAGDPAASEPPIFLRLDRWREERARPLGETVGRHAWKWIECSLFRLSLPHAFRWRRMLLRVFGAQLDATSALRPGVRVIHPWRLTIGAYSELASGVTVYCLGPVVIGAHTVISQDTYLCAGTHDHRQRHFPLLELPITIGNGVWIAAGAFIGPGVSVGDNSIVAARAVVVEDVPPGVIVAGNPARVVGERPIDGRDSEPCASSS